MRIGFDAKRAFQNRTGLGNYSRTLLNNLNNFFSQEEYILFAPKKNTEYSDQFRDNAIITPSGNSILWRSFGIKKDMQAAGIDLFHGLSNELPFGMRRSGIPSVVTIHDVIFDIIKDDFPWHDRWIYRLKTKKCIEESTKIIAISQSTRNDIIRFFGADPDKIHVIYQPIDHQFEHPEFTPAKLETIRQKYQLPDQYLLYVGALMRRKNVLPMIQAWQQLPTEYQFPLLIFGEGNQYRQEIAQYLRTHHLEGQVQIRNRMPFEDLPSVYHMSQSVIYPSLYEGFGLPVAEALACGSRVVTSSVSSMPEAGGPLCSYVDPMDIDSIADGIVRSLQSERPHPDAVEKHLSRFDSFTLTQQIINLYRELCGN
ncbi:MAG TPA: glycosyltransferase family 1 protein [Membranihabitans sp.]|nr:glycosyltransferase family 1 protein [Membranihabitans sp.]